MIYVITHSFGDWELFQAFWDKKSISFRKEVRAWNFLW